MDAAGYATLTRQSGLMAEIQTVANNVANASTSGYKRSGVIFSEYIKQLEDAPSLSMARASSQHIDMSQASLSQTGGTFDFGIQGEGFFLVQTPNGNRLTRAGSFTPSATGELVTPNGHQLLDQGGAPVFIPPNVQAVKLSSDGTLSADGQPLARVSLWQPAEGTKLTLEAGSLFAIAGEVEPSEDGMVLQGFIEESNVDSMSEIARMIEVQRAYEMGQSFLEREDERVRGVIQILGR